MVFRKGGWPGGWEAFQRGRVGSPDPKRECMRQEHEPLPKLREREEKVNAPSIVQSRANRKKVRNRVRKWTQTGSLFWKPVRSENWVGKTQIRLSYNLRMAPGIQA